jgi:hypothetical protein
MLRQELIGRIDAQACNIRKLESSNAGLVPKVEGLTSSNEELKSSNIELSKKVQGLATSNAEMALTLQRVSQLFVTSSGSALNLVSLAAYPKAPHFGPAYGP